MIQLTHEIKNDTLFIIADEDAQNALKEMMEEPDFQSDATLYDAFEQLIANSELMWVHPEDTGDLTNAPLLGILGEMSEDKTGPYGFVDAGQDDKTSYYHPIVNRWGFEPYQLRSPLEDLANTGKAVFLSEW